MRVELISKLSDIDKNDWDNINNCFIVAYVYDAESLIIQDVVKKAIINE